MRPSSSWTTSEARFDCGFESGNIGRVERIDSTIYDLYIRPDTLNNHFRLWFYFRVTDVSCGNEVYIFNIVNICKPRTCFSNGATPVVRSSSRPNWERLPESQVFYYTSPRHKAVTSNPILSIAFRFDKITDEYFFALTYPYTSTMLSKFLLRLDSVSLPVYRRFTLVRSVQDRAVDLLVITSGSARGKRLILATARVHPGEAPSSFVMHGILEFLLSSHPAARIVRRHCVVLLVPMLNPDGVALGNYRANSFGFDLNRQFVAPEETQHPIIAVLKNLILWIAESGASRFPPLLRMLMQTSESVLLQRSQSHAATPTKSVTTLPVIAAPKPESEQSAPVDDVPSVELPANLAHLRAILGEIEGAPLDFVIDLHSHSTAPGGFFFTNPDIEELPPDLRQSGAPSRGELEQLLPLLAQNFCAGFQDWTQPVSAHSRMRQPFRHSSGAAKAGSSRRALVAALAERLPPGHVPFIYGIEVSNGHGPELRLTPHAAGEKGGAYCPYTPQSYTEMGASIGQALALVYRSQDK